MTTDVQNGLSDYAAELAITLMLMLTQRDIANGASQGWRPERYTATRLAGKTLGIVGFGKVGREVARRAHIGFGMKVLAYDRLSIADNDLAAVKARQTGTLEELLAECDFVSLHCPDAPENRHLIDAVKLNAMKPTAYLINTSHGELIDGQALAQAMWFDTIAGAGIDLVQDDIKANPDLAQCDRVVLLNHVKDNGTKAA